MTPAIDISALADWSEPKEVPTRYGPRILRMAAPSEAFSAAWADPVQKDLLRAAGAGFTKDYRAGTWNLSWWQKINGTEQARREQTIVASRQATTSFQPPAPEGRTYLDFQRAGIEFALNVLRQPTKRKDSPSRGVLIADAMGL